MFFSFAARAGVCYMLADMQMRGTRISLSQVLFAEENVMRYRAPVTVSLVFAIPLLMATVSGAGAIGMDQIVNVYSSRHYPLDKIIYGNFEKATGIRVNVVSGNVNALFERLKREGRNSPADVLITVDAGNLGRAQAGGLFQPMKSDIVAKAVPAHLREPNGLWTGLTMRARVIMYAKDRVKPSQLSTYESLADPKWKGKLLVRSSNSIYNQSLVASMIAVHGADEAADWAKGVVANMARKPKGGDRDQIKAVMAGEGDIAISNTYYLGLMSESKNAEDRAAIEKIGVFFPNQGNRGAHVNVSGAGLTKYAPHKASGTKLIEFLVSKEVQELVAKHNYEYPVREDVEWAPVVASWGKFRMDKLNVAEIGAKNPAAVRLLDKVGWR
jgi:iron(III) transport system substrate-binding protein